MLLSSLQNIVLDEEMYNALWIKFFIIAILYLGDIDFAK